MGAKRYALLRDLKSRIARIEGRLLPNCDPVYLANPSGSHHPSFQKDFLRFDISEIDEAFSRKAMPLNGLHEIRSQSRDGGLASGFLNGLLIQLMEKTAGPIFWVITHQAYCETGLLYGPGLAQFGLDPERLIFATACKMEDALWAVEEALTLKELTAVICDLQLHAKTLSLTESRRLQLRAEKNGIPVFLKITGAADTITQNAALTRWQIGPAPSVAFRDFEEGVGFPVFDVELAKNRMGRTAHALLLWDPHHARFEKSPSRITVGKEKPAHTGTVVSYPFKRSVDAA